MAQRIRGHVTLLGEEPYYFETVNDFRLHRDAVKPRA